MPKSEYGAAWERQPKESSPAYEAFSIYRDMGAERSLRAVAKQLSKSYPLILRWNGRWNWQERVRDYDNSIQREAQAKAYKKAVDSLAEMQTRHIKTAVLMQKRAVEALDIINISTLKPADIIRLIEVGAAIERSIRVENEQKEKPVNIHEMEYQIADANTIAAVEAFVREELENGTEHSQGNNQ